MPNIVIPEDTLKRLVVQANSYGLQGYQTHVVVSFRREEVGDNKVLIELVGTLPNLDKPSIKS